MANYVFVFQPRTNLELVDTQAQFQTSAGLTLIQMW